MLARKLRKVSNQASKPEPTEEDVARWKADPVLFALQALGLSLWKKQQAILRELCKSSRIAVRSGHKIGKSKLAAVMALWWIVTHPSGVVVMTSSSGRQVERILWAEVRKCYQSAVYNFGGRLALKPSSGLTFPDGRIIYGFSTDEPDIMAGISGHELLFLADEASGIQQDIFEAIEGNTAGGGVIVMFSNPLRPVGYFYEAFAEKAKFWSKFAISSEETPNATEGKTIIPGLAERKWIEEIAEKWGRESAYFAVRVLGNFPVSGSNVVFSLRLVEEAMKRVPSQPDEDLLVCGLDVAEFGDDESILTMRRGVKVYPQLAYRGMDGVDLVGSVLMDLRRFKRPNERPVVFIDSTGVGHGAWANMVRHEEVRAYGVRMADCALNKLEYGNRRAEIHFKLKEKLKTMCLPPSEDLRSQLIAPVYGFDQQGRLMVEKKDKLKARLGRSPDHSDSLCLCAIDPPKETSYELAVGSGSLRGR
jgi:phage terminase large subunit